MIEWTEPNIGEVHPWESADPMVRDAERLRLRIARAPLALGPVEARPNEDQRFEVCLDSIWGAAVEAGGAIPLDRTTLVPMRAYAAATKDVFEIADMMRDGHGIGVVGAGVLVALDLEHPSKKSTDGFATVADLAHELGPLPRTRQHGTKSGGLHYVFRLPAGAKVHPAVEVLRGFGVATPGLDVVTGLLRFPPTPGYTITCDASIADLPIAWLDAISDPPPPKRERVKREQSDGFADLERRANRVASLGAGRSAALNAAAYWQAKTSDVSEDAIVSVLLAAAEQNGSIAKRGQRACERGIRAGARKGRS